MKRIAGLIILLMIAVGMTAKAQTNKADSIAQLPMMELQVGKIILYPERMGMTGSESLMTCLQSLPALVQKGTVDLLSNFTLEEDGNTYLQDPTIYLQQTQISEVAEIEIITDGSVSDGLSGVMGIINVITKDAEIGTHGHGDMMFNTHGEFYPTVYASYRKGYFSAIGSIMGLSDRDKTDTYITTPTNESSHEYNKTTYRDEAAKVKLKWDLPRDMFLFKLSQLYGKTQTRDTISKVNSDGNSLQSKYSKIRSNKINCSFEYNHTFNNGGVFKASAGIENFGNTDKSDSQTISSDLNGIYTATGTLTSSLDDTYATTTNWSATVKYVTPISNWGALTISLPMSWTAVDQDIYRQLGETSQNEQLRMISQEYNTDVYYPYFIFGVRFNSKWNLKFGQRFTYIHYSMSDNTNSKWTTNRSEWFVNAGVQYHPAPDHTLQANFRRTAAMPGVLQLYPYYWFASSPNIYYTGNQDLKPSTFMVYDLGYTFHKKRLQLSTSLQYYVNNNSIENVEITTTSATYGELPLICMTSRNIGKIRTYDTNLSAVYSVGLFQAMAGVNIYHQVNNRQEHITWCCLRISPTLRLPHQWAFSAQLSYVSPQKSELQVIGKSYYGLMRLSKTWNNGISVFAYWENFLDNNSVITNYSSATAVSPSSITNIAYHENKISFGISYKFL